MAPRSRLADPRPDTPRPKRGRPPGVPNRITTIIRERTAAEGLLPHEILLSIARGEPQMPNGEIPPLEMRQRAAQAAAPYYAPRQAAIITATMPALPSDMESRFRELLGLPPTLPTIQSEPIPSQQTLEMAGIGEDDEDRDV